MEFSSNPFLSGGSLGGNFPLNSEGIFPNEISSWSCEAGSYGDKASQLYSLRRSVKPLVLCLLLAADCPSKSHFHGRSSRRITNRIFPFEPSCLMLPLEGLFLQENGSLPFEAGRDKVCRSRTNSFVRVQALRFDADRLLLFEALGDAWVSNKRSSAMNLKLSYEEDSHSFIFI